MTQTKENATEFVIRYEFTKSNGKITRYKVKLDNKTLTRTDITVKPEHARWTRLEHKQCEHCSLSREEHKHCPAALAISEIIDDWSDVNPMDEVHIHCRTPERKISTHASVQNGLGTLMGLLLATSACPHFDLFKPMARFHLPAATITESYYRVLGTYFMNEYFSKRYDISNAMTDIQNTYNNLEIVNHSLSTRLFEAKNQHSTVSALVVLDLLAKMFTVYPEESLQELENMFKVCSKP